MMNEAEKRVLHGLYANGGTGGELAQYHPAEINWLAQTHIPATRNWRRPDGSYHAADESIVDVHARKQQVTGSVAAALEKPLQHLKEAGYITYSKEGGRFRVGLTNAGEVMARQLDTPAGRRSLWYRSHRGLVWLIAVAIVIPIVLIAVRVLGTAA